MTTHFYIEHTSNDDENDIAYFGPIPEGAKDVLNQPEAEPWAQTGELRIVDSGYLLSEDVACVNPWSVWLDPDSTDEPIRDAYSGSGNDEHTVLVAFSVRGPNHEQACRRLGPHLAAAQLIEEQDPVIEWWIAEDDRSDGSDNDSAVFVTLGRQYEASRILAKHGLTAEHNVVER